MINPLHFDIDPVRLPELVAVALRSGGDWCDLFFEDTVYTTLLLRDGEVSSGGSHVDYGCGIRVLCGEKTGYAYSESTEWDNLVQAAKAASAIANSRAAEATPPTRFGAPPLIPPKQAWAPPSNDAEGGTPLGGVLAAARKQLDWRDAATSEFVPVLQAIESRIRAKDSRVHKVMASLAWQVSEILMYNSLGETIRDTRPIGSIVVTTVFVQDGKSEISNASRSFSVGAEMIDDALIDVLVEQSVKGIDERFEARRPKGGKMPVVMGAGASGILLHEAMGHAFEADFNRKGQSIFSGMMGKPVARKGINIVDDGTIAGNRGFCRWDDEGTPGQKTYMVEDGILRSYLHDRISAKFFGVAPTGNGRRESFRYNPIPRMRCTNMESGADGTLEDIISSVKKGIFVDQFSNGQVKIGEGDFTFYVKSGRLIENGRLTMPVKDINIVGNGPRALADIVAVAGDLRIDDGTWTCGKEQSVPVSCGIPSVLVKQLTVGGE